MAKVYVTYRTEGSSGESYRVSEVELSDRGSVGRGAERVPIEQAIGHLEHIGGDLEFDDWGFLLVSIGDNGRRNDDAANAQALDRGLFSGILRIDVDRRGGDASHPPPRQPLAGRTSGYFIPNDNPFVGRSGILEEFWAIGFGTHFE